MHDLRLAFRALRATPIVTVIAVLSLALGIGANTAIFSLVNSLLLRSLPIAEPERLATLGSWQGARWDINWMYETWNAFRPRADAFEGAFAVGDASVGSGSGFDRWLTFRGSVWSRASCSIRMRSI